MNQFHSTRFFMGLIALSYVLAAQAGSPSGVQLGSPQVVGSGCDASNTSAVLSPDYTSLSILFSSFTAEAGGATGVLHKKKNCDINIPVRVPNGYSMAIYNVDYRGFNFLPAGGSSHFSASYDFSGLRGPVFLQDFRGPLNDSFVVSHSILRENIAWSPCGGDTNLRINAGIKVWTNPGREQVMSSIDSVDVASAMVYQLQWRECNPNPAPSPGPGSNPNPPPPPPPTSGRWGCALGVLGFTFYGQGRTQDEARIQAYDRCADRAGNKKQLCRTGSLTCSQL